ncbi:MAG: putative toxin-antitoxin system toxin component, PIN family [Candidatus Altiarchaeota archaeon]|nr:putative toxin-antitoxin system toxin component, PIN family [Candidatus Altiarchaeota archaeon]
MKVVADTNVLVSALFWEGNERRVIHLAEEGEIELLISSGILEELKEVLWRDHFQLRLTDLNTRIDDVVNRLMSVSTLVDSTKRLNTILEDPADNRVLECAVAGKADYIVSGDSHLLSLREFKGIKIIKAKNLLEILKK